MKTVCFAWLTSLMGKIRLELYYGLSEKWVLYNLLIISFYKRVLINIYSIHNFLLHKSQHIIQLAHFRHYMLMLQEHY